MAIENSPVGNVQLMQKMNRLKVLNYIRENTEVSRPGISKYTGLSPSSITNIVNFLIDRKLVCEGGRIASKDAGRKAALIRFNPSAAVILAVNIDARAVTFALTDLDGGIITREQHGFSRKPTSEEIFSSVKKGIDSIMRGAASRNIVAAGIALSGLVLDDGRIEISTTFELRSLPFKEYFEKEYELPVYVQNNSRTKALGVLDKINAAADEKIIFLDLASGVGMVSIENMKINDSVIGEIGHTTIEKDGPQCFCGNHGCLEVLCSVEYMVSEYKKVLFDREVTLNDEVNYDMIIKAVSDKDPDAMRIAGRCGEYLGMGIANIINLFYPKKIIINPDEILKCEYLFEKAVFEAKKRAYEHFVSDLDIINVSVDSDDAVKGISLYVADKVFDLMSFDTLLDG